MKIIILNYIKEFKDNYILQVKQIIKNDVTKSYVLFKIANQYLYK